MSAQIHVNCPQQCFELERRLTRSNGILTREHEVLGIVGTPKDDWEKVGDIETSDLLSEGSTLSRSSVTVIDLRDKTFETLSGIRDALLHSFKHNDFPHRHHRIHDLIDEAIVYTVVSIEAVVERKVKRILHARLGINGPFMESTGYNVQTRSFMGLHYDRYKKFEPDGESYFQIIGLNLGLCERYFCFSTLLPGCVSEIRKENGQHHNPLDETASGVGSFLQVHKTVHIYRIAFDPLQAYIAPTQCIIHDGMTNKHGLPDVNLFIACQFYDN